LSGRVGDVRKAGYAVSMAVDGRFGGVRADALAVDGLHLFGDLEVDDVRSRGPQTVRTDLRARTNRFRFGQWKTPVSLRLDGSLHLVEDRLVVRSARVDLGRDGRLAAVGRLKRVLSGRPSGWARASLRVFDFDALWSKVPPALRGAAGDLYAEGSLDATADLRGRWPLRWPDGVDWANPPVAADLTVHTQGLGVRSETWGVDFVGLTSTVCAAVKSNYVSLQPRGRLNSWRSEGFEAAQVDFDGDLGLADGTWRAKAALQAEAVRGVLDGRRVEDTARASFDARYTPRGDLHLREFRARLPSAGLNIGLSGRLRRGANRTWTPAFKVDGAGDLTALARWLPSARPGAGRFELKLSSEPGPKDTLSVVGAGKGQGLGWRTSAWAVEDVSGSIAVSQRVYLPPSNVEQAPDGWLGDDFEVQMRNLLQRLQNVRLVVDPEVDIRAVAPRTADHYALKPYRGADDVELVARTLRLGTTTMHDLRAEARLHEGVLRIDRFQGRLWEGDLLFDLAIQANTTTCSPVCGARSPILISTFRMQRPRTSRR
ncbi:MAG: hypothetical protein AAF449_21110, partial [Myxococcota bacterium]